MVFHISQEKPYNDEIVNPWSIKIFATINCIKNLILKSAFGISHHMTQL